MSLLELLKPNGKTKHLVTDEIVNQVFTTCDYSKFKIIDTNRDVNDSNLKRITESFLEAYLFTVIIVNEDFEIIDGQHRYYAAKETGNPIYYVIVPNYGIKEVQRYNTNGKTWNRKDFLHCYTEEGKPAYKELEQFMQDFPDFGIQVSIKIMTGVDSRGVTTIIDGKKLQSKNFEQGKLKIRNTAKSYIEARKVLDFKEFYSGFSRSTFVSSLIPLFGNKAYSHSRMLDKLKKAPIHLYHCANVEQYRILLQKIYNWKARPDDRSDFVNI